MRTRSKWTAIACKRSSDDPREVITVEVMEDGAALPRGTRLQIDRPACGNVRTMVTVDGAVVDLDLDHIEEIQ
jgi:hypothetical protein